MQDFAAGRLKAVVSDIVSLEVNQGFDKLQAQFQQLLASQPEWVNVTDEVVILADAYQSHKILTPKYYADGLHIALATIADVDVLVSWNFKHIVNFHRIRLFNGVNLSLGYKAIQIFSPLEVVTDEED